MTTSRTDQTPADLLDVRTVRKPDRHPIIVAAFNALRVGDSLTLVNDHDPLHLREEFESERPGCYEWEYVSSEPDVWRIRITKLTSTTLPRVLGNTQELSADAGDLSTQGAVWNLATSDRDLDSNVIAIPPYGAIDAHTGPDLGVLLHVLAGSGQLVAERGQVDLEPGALVWLPARSKREIKADSTGLRYLTVHKRRQSLVIDTAAHRDSHHDGPVS